MEILGENNFKSVTRPKNLSSQIEEQLQNAINKGVFSVGELLPSESKLVEIFNVSRGVIREALLMLSAKWIIEIQKGKGAIVLNPSAGAVICFQVSFPSFPAEDIVKIPFLNAIS